MTKKEKREAKRARMRAVDNGHFRGKWRWVLHNRRLYRLKLHQNGEDILDVTVGFIRNHGDQFVRRSINPFGPTGRAVIEKWRAGA